MDVSMHDLMFFSLPPSSFLLFTVYSSGNAMRCGKVWSVGTNRCLGRDVRGSILTIWLCPLFVPMPFCFLTPRPRSLYVLGLQRQMVFGLFNCFFHPSPCRVVVVVVVVVVLLVLSHDVFPSTGSVLLHVSVHVVVSSMITHRPPLLVHHPVFV